MVLREMGQNRGVTVSDFFLSASFCPGGRPFSCQKQVLHTMCTG